MRICCTALLFVLLAYTTTATVEGLSVRGGRVICRTPSFLSLCDIVSAPLTTMKMMIMTTLRMVSKDWMKEKNDNEEYKKGKRTFGYAGKRYPEQERLEEEESARNPN